MESELKELEDFLPPGRVVAATSTFVYVILA